MAPLITRNEELLRRARWRPSCRSRASRVATRPRWPRPCGRRVHGMAELVMLGHLPREVAEPALAALRVSARRLNASRYEATSAYS